MEFLRFGSSIPGEYWGCCCADIIQNFNQDPSTKASIQLVSGDGGGGLMQGSELAFAGPTLEDIFRTRIRIGTFSTREMPNHIFFAILTDSQCASAIGKKWLKIMKEEGFEFFRKVNNSVWNVNNNVFILARNCGTNGVANPFTPPASWTELEQVVPEAYCADLSTIEKQKAFAAEMTAKQKARFAKGKTVILKESEIVAAGAPVIMAGLRSEFPPQKKAEREKRMTQRKDNKLTYQPSAGTQHLY